VDAGARQAKSAARITQNIPPISTRRQTERRGKILFFAGLATRFIAFALALSQSLKHQSNFSILKRIEKTVDRKLSDTRERINLLTAKVKVGMH
jgi:hypothetical protein